MDEDKIFELAEKLADESFGKTGLYHYSERQELAVHFDKILTEEIPKLKFFPTDSEIETYMEDCGYPEYIEKGTIRTFVKWLREELVKK